MPPETGRTVEHAYFTIIGPAVNRANRLLDLVERLDRQVLVSHPLAREVDEPLVDLGSSVRGMGAAAAGLRSA
jgi:class 3 adenylate cyclase